MRKRTAVLLLAGAAFLSVLPWRLAAQDVEFKKITREVVESTLRGESDSTIIVGGHFDNGGEGHGVFDSQLK